LGQFLQDDNPIINRRKLADVAALELLVRSHTTIEGSGWCPCWYRDRRIRQVEGVTAWGEGMVELEENRHVVERNRKSMDTAARRKRRRGRGVERINTINTHSSGAQTSNFQLR
jgi:hypothetical protein